MLACVLIYRCCLYIVARVLMKIIFYTTFYENNISVKSAHRRNEIFLYYEFKLLIGMHQRYGNL